MLPILPLIIGAAAGAAATQLVRTKAVQQGLKKAGSQIRQAGDTLKQKASDGLDTVRICTHYDIARFDQQEVRRQARNSLPGGDLLVLKNTSGDAIDIWVLWKQPNVPGLDDDALSSDRFCPRNVQGNNHRPQCLQLGVKL